MMISQRAHSRQMHSGRMSNWGLRRTVSALAVAAAVAGVGGAAIAAATDGNHHTFGGSMHGSFGGPGGPPPPAAAHRSDDLDSIHGVYVVADRHGGFRTLMTQTGRVTAISADSVTARSDDGFTATVG